MGRLLVGLLLTFAAVRVVAALWGLTAGDDRLPQWDPAKYGGAGVRLADAVRDGEVGEFLRQVNRLSLWPPLYPVVVELPVFLVAGGEYRVADEVAGGCVLLAALAAWACGWAVAEPLRNGGGAPAGGIAWGRRALGGGPGVAPACAPLRAGSGRTEEGQPRARVEPPGEAVRRRDVTPGGREIAAELAGGVTAALMLVSPAVHLFGTISMLEVPGALLTLVALWAYSRSLETGRAGNWRGACAAATGLFFLKYNYGLLWLVPLDYPAGRSLPLLSLPLHTLGRSPLRRAASPGGSPRARGNPLALQRRSGAKRSAGGRHPPHSSQRPPVQATPPAGGDGNTRCVPLIALCRDPRPAPACTHPFSRWR